MQYKNYTPNYEIVAPKGISESLANLKNCLPNGIPIIVMQRRHPQTALAIAIGIPVTMSQIMLAIRLTGNTLILYDTMYRLLQLFLQIFISKSLLFL